MTTNAAGPAVGDAAGQAAGQVAEQVAAYRRLMSAVAADVESTVDELFDAEFVDHNPVPGQAPGPEGFKQWMRAARSAFPDLAATVADVVADSDRVAARVRYRGTHRGDFLAVPATGTTVEFEAFHVVRFRNGKVLEWWGTADLLGVLLQLGARIAPPGA